MNLTYRGVELEDFAGDDSQGLELEPVMCDAHRCMAGFDGDDSPFVKHGDFYFCPAHLEQVEAYRLPEACGSQQFNADIERQRRFASHQVNEEQAARIADLRVSFLSMSERIARKVKPGREQSAALTHLEEAMFFSIAGIARETK